MPDKSYRFSILPFFGTIVAMLHRSTVVFVFLAAVFAVTHVFAITASLYWYYWWFDIFMHFWGGGLLALGMFSLSTFSRCSFRPSVTILLLVMFPVLLSWEVFEWGVGLYNPATHLQETLKDIFVGLSGGLLAHSIFQNSYNKQI